MVSRTFHLSIHSDSNAIIIRFDKEAKKMKKNIPIILALLVLGFVFFYSDEKQKDDLSEVSYWKFVPEEIRYFPPKESPVFSGFISTQLSLQRFETGIKSTPLFSVQGIDFESKESYLYEGNYTVKNLFTELSALTIFSLNVAKPDLLEKFNISVEKSPALEILKSSKIEKKIYLGEENRDKSRRYLLSDKDLIIAGSHIFKVFSNTAPNLRERQYIQLGAFELTRLQFQSESIRLTIENNPEIKNGISNRRLYKIANGKLRMEPATSDSLFSLLPSIKAVLYPDESEGEGYLVAKELISTDSIAQLDIFFQNGLHYKIKLFPKVVLKNKAYYPVVKEVEKYFVESPSYTSEQTVTQTMDLLKKIQSAPEWTETKGK